MKITVVLGTGREGRNSERVSEFINQTLVENGYETQYVDIRNFESPRTIAKWAPDEISESWREIVDQTDLMIVVSPEYNHSFPGELKILFDRIIDEYKDKPVIIAGTSAGDFGGARAVEFLIHYLCYIGFNYESALYFPHIDQEFTEEGTTENPKHAERLLKAVESVNSKK